MTMQKTVEMAVSLRMPDTTAITALQTLHNIGFNKIKAVKRADYYKFTFEGDEEKFKNEISKVDILANANKHSVDFSAMSGNEAKILVKSTDDGGSGIMATLKKRLGFKNIKSAEKGTLWSMSIDENEAEAKKIAEKAAKELFVNEHYQEYEIL